MKPELIVGATYLSTSGDYFEIVAERQGWFIGYGNQEAHVFTRNGVAPAHKRNHGVILDTNVIDLGEV